MAYTFDDLVYDVKVLRNNVDKLNLPIAELAEDAFNTLDQYRYDQLKENELLDGKLYMSELAIIAAIAVKGDFRNDD